MRRAGAAVALAAALAGAAPAAAGACARESVPAPPAAPARVEAVDAYLQRLDGASTRVATGSIGRSVEGRPLRFAIAGAPGAIATPALTQTSEVLRAVRDGRRRGLPRGQRAIAWLAAGVHGNERSGVDADLRLLHELAAGRHCAVLRRLIVVVLPMQNPDGVAAGSRTNANGFDLNRDWFAATQPETAPKLRLLGELPPLVFADQHEQDGGGFFFPPNAEPIHHEIPVGALRAMARRIGPELGAAFDREGLAHTSGAGFDLFFMGYGDSVTSTLFGAAGMTFEKGSAVPYGERVGEHLLAARTLLRTVARHRDPLLRAWARSWHEARRQGARGELQSGAAVPRRPVHAYLLRNDVHGGDANALAARLAAVGVEVLMLRREVTLPAFRAYGSTTPERATLPAGTWVVPMAQTRKHWVEAMLGQDAYAAVPSADDASSWSNPLLMGLEGGWTERPLPAGSTFAVDLPLFDDDPNGLPGDSVGALRDAVRRLGDGAPVWRTPGTGTFDVISPPPPGAVALRAPRVALLADLQPRVLGRAGHEDSALHESHAWMRWVLAERLGMPPTTVAPAEIAAGGLAGFTALVVADGRVPDGAIGRDALDAIDAFVAGGGTFAGVRSLGVDVAEAAGISTVRERAGGSFGRTPGATFAVTIDGDDPVGWGLGGAGFQYNAADPVLAPGGGTAVVRYPERVGFVSGRATDLGPLLGTPAVVDARHGDGRVVLFASDPAYRGYVESGQRLLGNALLAPPPVVLGR